MDQPCAVWAPVPGRPLHHGAARPIQGIGRYLGSGLIKGIGPKLAERIVDRFGIETLDVIEERAERLIEVPGLGPKRTAMIAAAWQEQKAIKEVMVFLQGVGVSTSLAVRIYKAYRDAAISVVKNEPYRLATDVWGLGFKTADRIAASQGVPHDSPQRVLAGLQFALSAASEEGHCYLPEGYGRSGRSPADPERLLARVSRRHGFGRREVSP